MSSVGYIRSVLQRARVLVLKHDGGAVVRLEIMCAADGSLSWFLWTESTKLAVGRKRTAKIGGIGSTLLTAEKLFIEGLERAIEAHRDSALPLPKTRG